MTDVDDVKRAVRELNAAWLAGRIDDLAPFFHEGVVAVPPGAVARSFGRDAMIHGFKDYLAAAKTHRFEELALDVDAFGDTAVATLRFQVRYQLGEVVHDETGLDLMVFTRARDRWLIVWRMQVPIAAA